MTSRSQPGPWPSKSSAGPTIARAALAAALALAAQGAAAQEMPGFPRDTFGAIVLSDRQSLADDIELEAPIADYNNEPISIYGEGSLFRELGRPIGRLDIQTDVRNVPCTAFVVSKRHIVTNHHCVPGLAANARLGASRIDAVRLVLGYTVEGVEEGARAYSVSPTPVEADETLDYAVLEVFGDPSAEFGTIALSGADVAARTPFWIIGHPLGEAQRMSREGCRAADPGVSAGRVRHLCDTMPGNSGSPVIDPGSRAVVALHHAGSRSRGVNYAIPMADILARSDTLRGLTQDAAVAAAPGSDSAAPNARLAEAIGAWASLSESEDAVLLEAFAAAYEGTFVADAARQRIAMLRERDADAAQAEQAAKALRDAERKKAEADRARADEWRRLRDRTPSDPVSASEIDELAAFVARHRGTSEASAAGNRLQELRQKAREQAARATREAAERRRADEWQRLRLTGSIDELTKFVSRNRGTAEASAARERLRELRRDRERDEKPATTDAVPILLAKHGVWEAYRYRRTEDELTCYVLARPTSSEPTDRVHGDVFLMVTNRLHDDITGEVSFVVGYPLEQNSVTSRVDGRSTPKWFTQEDGAWLELQSGDEQTVSAMRAGRTITVSAKSERGTATSYTFSLSGVSRALDEIADCETL